METFKVISVVDGDTFDVLPSRQWNGQSGSRDRPAGYDAPELGTQAGEKAKAKLSGLILGQQVELGTAHKFDRGCTVCDVYCRDRDPAGYFGVYVTSGRTNSCAQTHATS